MDFKKYICSILLYALIFSPARAVAVDTYFIETQPPVEFSDCTPTDWYYENVRLCQQVGLMIGTGEHFKPLARLSQAEAIILAARLHMAYNGGVLPTAENSTDWFRPYEKYAIANNLIEGNMDLATTTPSNRGEFVSLILRAVPNTQFPAINTITAIPDVDPNTEKGSGILLLYNAGVLTGLNEYGYFQPDSLISRAEVAAILCRVIRPETRIKFELSPFQETSAQVTALPEVFQNLYITDFNGSVITATHSSPQFESALFDLSGTQLIPFQKGMILPESDGIFQVNRGYYEDDDSDKVVYFTMDGQQLNDIEFDRGTSFVDGSAFVQNMLGKQYGPIAQLDTSGKLVKTFDNQDGYQIFKNLTGRYCLLFHHATQAYSVLDSATGKIEAFPYSANTVSEGRLLITAENFQVGYLADDLSMVVEPRYALGRDFQNGLAVVYAGAGYGAIDTNGDLILPARYKSLSNFNSSKLAIAQVQTEEKWIYCVIDAAGNVYSTLDQEQTVVAPYKLYDSYISYQTAAGYQLLDLEGNPLADGLVGQRIIPSQERVIFLANVDNDKYLYYVFSAK